MAKIDTFWSCNCDRRGRPRFQHRSHCHVFAEREPVEITMRGGDRGRGFYQYGDPFRSDYGDMVEVYESSSAEGPKCWLRIYDGGYSQIEKNKNTEMAAHLAIDDAIALRDRLDAFIEDTPNRWGWKDDDV